MKALSLLLYLFLSPFLEPTVPTPILYFSALYLKPCIQVDREREIQREGEREREREGERHTHTQRERESEREEEKEKDTNSERDLLQEREREREKLKIIKMQEISWYYSETRSCNTHFNE